MHFYTETRICRPHLAHSPLQEHCLNHCGSGDQKPQDPMITYKQGAVPFIQFNYQSIQLKTQSSRTLGTEDSLKSHCLVGGSTQQGCSCEGFGEIHKLPLPS